MTKHDVSLTTGCTFYEPGTVSLQYLRADKASSKAAIIDPVLVYARQAGATGTARADAILDCARAEGLEVAWVLDTHPHAEHFSAAVYCGEKLGAPRAIGEQVREVLKLWHTIYCLPDLATDGSPWDRLVAAGHRLQIGKATGWGKVGQYG